MNINETAPGHFRYHFQPVALMLPSSSKGCYDFSPIFILQEARESRHGKCFPEFSFICHISYHATERLFYITFLFYYFPILETSKYSKQFTSKKKYLPFVSLQVPKPFPGPVRLHSSNPNLSTLDFGEEKNYSDGSETSSEFSKMQEDLCHIAHKGK